MALCAWTFSLRVKPNIEAIMISLVQKHVFGYLQWKRLYTSDFLMSLEGDFGSPEFFTRCVTIIVTELWYEHHCRIISYWFCSLLSYSMLVIVYATLTIGYTSSFSMKRPKASNICRRGRGFKEADDGHRPRESKWYDKLSGDKERKHKHQVPGR